jgi:putative mycofactocin binding protein MftB
MASAACTEPAAGVRYVVPGAVRVRPEDFGLLFYDTRTTHLTFVRSGGRVTVAPGAAGEERELLLDGGDGRPDATARLLQTLQEKGLIRAVGGAD